MINENCSCPNKNCERHGNCSSCIEFHKNTEVSAFCLRLKNTDNELEK